MKRNLIILLTILLLAPMLVACGGDDGDNDPPEPTQAPRDPSAILAAASTRIADIQSLKFTLEIEGATYIDTTKTIQLLNARGTLSRPNLVDVQFQVKLLGTQTASIRMITAGDQSWTTDLISGNWGPAPEEFGYDPSRLFDTQNGLGPVMGKITDPMLSGEEEISGRAAWKVTGVVTDEVIGPVTANTMQGEEVRIELWIDKETNDLLRVQLVEPEEAGNDDPATWVMDLGEHDEPVTIEPPV